MLLRILIGTLAVGAATAQSDARDWIFRPSTYSHDPVTHQRVTQFAPLPPVVVYQRPDYLRSGLRQQRSTIRAGGSLDSYHVVDRYGENIRPYGEWLFPYRPYGVPYDAWGPPFGGVNGEVFADEHLRGFPDFRGRRRGGFRGGYYGPDGEFGAGPYPPYDGDYRRRPRLDGRFDRRSRVRERFNGLFDGRGIPGDDEHYLDPPSRLDQMGDREFFSRPGRREGARRTGDH